MTTLAAGGRDKLNVLMVSTQPTGGGAARCAESLASQFAATGHGVEWFVRDVLGGSDNCRRVTHWRSAGLARRLSRMGFPELGDLASLLWRCRAEFGATDVVHLHNLHGDYLSLLAMPLWGRDKPLVWTLHDHWPLTGNCATPRSCDRWRRTCGRCPLVGVYPMGPRDRSRAYRALKPRLFAAARPRLVAPSQWLARRVREVPQLRRLPLRIIRYPINTEIFSPCVDRLVLRRALGLKLDRPTVVMSGHGWSDPFKGGQHALTALRIARSRIPSLQLCAVGVASDSLLRASGLDGVALPFLDDRASLAAAYACADVCLFPSLAENYPLTVLEAMACETPVIAYSVGGIPEQIEHLRTGYVADEGRPDALAGGLMCLLSSGAKLRAMGGLARRFVVETSSIDIIAEQYLDEYRRAIAAWLRRRHRTTPRFARSALMCCLARVLGWDELCEPFSSGAPHCLGRVQPERELETVGADSQ